MLEIRLIGPPSLIRDGAVLTGPRGGKCWAVMARVLSTHDPVSRQQLVNELFSEADDPMGALRWTLAEIRRRLGLPGAFSGNPVLHGLGPDTTVDIVTLADGTVPSPVPAGQLLEGVEIHASPSFETWLLVERNRVAGALQDIVRAAALRALSNREHARAIDLASALVAGDPFDEGRHVVLLKALVAAGHHDAASRHLRATEESFAAELGVTSLPALRAASRPAPQAIAGISPSASARMQVSLGRGAVAAGAVDAGIDNLRVAVDTAGEAGDDLLLAECEFELGAALVHSVCGFDDEGSVMLENARARALAAGDRELAAKALSELAYLDVLFARRASAAVHLAEAWEAAEGFPGVQASVAAYDAIHLADWGRLEESLDRFREALELCAASHSVRRRIWTAGHAARVAYIAGALEVAERWSREAEAGAEEERWTAVRPWPETWRAHARLSRGDDPVEVRADLEATYALARQLGDPCWQGASAKALGLTYVADGRPELALQWFADAHDACAPKTGAYRWVDAEVRVTQAEVLRDLGDGPTARDVATRALEDAARGDMPLLVARATAVLESLDKVDIPG
ncbi:BTAD domain-containing putative transcriptional regulator [Demequina sp. SYSU T00039]|uniref:BTAD domain-containing putative transcriptional regulator n=1 Tax=Demequina lignilytica TaxID=3051663 RepID=A0AAW7M5G4_9MICO|nr:MULTISPECIES: BTAD domain-containing putative transcriptional regulator [unclassified Demequina]MDN4478307.1 BTAD domain-containing putative transcriptional regulator [Demequina sp. SYSU T00039-1]MDN4487186.1 BTAD domain-containing putative transcriptional regulator [Demequina sp. SYSU T00039]